MTLPLQLLRPLGLLPVAPLEYAARLLFRRVLDAHPGLFERLGEHGAKRFSFAPTDLPFVFVIEPDVPRLCLYRKGAGVTGDAGVEAPLVILLSLLEGRCDADALFFSRDLQVMGDMEAMLAMRNALDDCDIDLPKDLSRMGGPMGPLLASLASNIRRTALKEVV